MKQTSLQYAHLLAWIAYFKHNVILNKTQMQKLLFMCYGQSLAMGKGTLFDDDKPKAWPFGPVFPRSYKIYEETPPRDLTNEEKGLFAEDLEMLREIATIVANYCHVSATRLSDWSHEKDGPWWKTVFGTDNPKWNREIQSDIIREYFKSEKWAIGI